MTTTAHQPLRELVEIALERYFSQIEDESVSGLHKMVIREVEMGLLNTVLRKTQGNQSRAATWLGLARGTLRKRLEIYGLDK